jgi:hypothetical protein
LPVHLRQNTLSSPKPAGNDISWDWFIKGPMKEFIIELRKLEEGNFPLFYSTDGEEIMLDSMLNSPSVE